MKINKYLCLITLLLLFTNSIFSQFDDINVRTLKMIDDEFLIDKDLYNFNNKNTGFGEDFNFWGDINFGGSNFAVINAGLVIEAQRKAALNEWYNKQRGLIKDEIDEFYNHSFDNYYEAVNKTFIDFGKKNHNVVFDFNRNVSNLKSNHIRTNKEYIPRNRVNIRELHHLDYRKQEILNGNINNSIFSFSEIYGGIKLKDIRDVNSINRNWNIIKGFLDTNLPTEQNAKYHSEELGNLDEKFDNFMLSLQRKFYDDELNPGQRLWLEQFSINFLQAVRANPNAFSGPHTINFNIPDGWSKGLNIPVGSEAVLQNYLWAYSKRSVFDPNYYLKVLDEILINNGYDPVYGDENKVPYWFVTIAKGQALERRNNAFNDLMNSSSTEDILTDLFITALGARNNAFLDARPQLRTEVEKYFKANNRSQYSHDGINWLLNQYQDNNVFPVDADLFKSKNAPLFQDAANPNRAIQIDFSNQAITEGITNFGNVLAELLRDNVNIEFENSIIKTIFEANGINISNIGLNNRLGYYYEFVNTDGNSIRINNSNVKNPLIGVDCASFEYALPPGQTRRACAVKNFDHKFYTLGPLPNGTTGPGEVESYVDTIYFTMPAYYTNGQAANYTATALTAAIRATDLYYATHSRATSNQISDFFYKSVTTSLAVYGGRATEKAPFSIRSPAPYLRSFFNAKTDCN